MILYGMRPSPFVRKVLFYAAEKGIALELVAAGLGRMTDGFAKASPFAKMPALEDGDFSISDSSAIITYLEALHPEPVLIPAEPRARARTIWFDEFGDTILFAAGSKIFFNRIVAPKVLGRDGDLELADMAEREELPVCYAYLETVVPESGYLMGDALTLADISVATPFVNFRYCCPPVDAVSYPKLAAWLDRVFARPAIAGVIAQEQYLIDAMSIMKEPV